MTRASFGWVLPALLAAVLAAQGWRGRAPTIDHVPLFDDARTAVQDGKLPTHSCLSSYGAFLPPGPSWLAIPGAALRLDSRLLELPGALALHFGAAAGAWLLAARVFGPAAGAIAAWVYCLSDLGLFYASSLWPRGPACASVWFAYFTVRWAADRQGRWLARAGVALSWGALVFLELAPVAAALPFVWLRSRPPLRSRAWWWALPLAVLPWAPYLRFQQERGFVDLRALVARRSLALPDPLPYFCDRAAKVVDPAGNELWPNPASGAPAGAQAPTGGVPAGVFAGLRANLPADAGWRLVGWWALLLAAFAAHRAAGGSKSNPGAGALLRTLLVPWALLLAMAERDAAADRRFWWLWPLHAAVVAGGATAVARRLSQVPAATIVVGAAALALAATAGRPRERLSDWRTHRFAGEEAPSRALLETIVMDNKADGYRSFSVSYSIHLWAHAFKFHPLDSRYRVGMELDLVLRDDLGMPNAVHCPEGVGRDANYVVEEKDLGARFPPALGPDYRLLAENRQFRLYKRK